MRIRVLGSAAGGGFPQWNCNCRNCRGARDGSLRAQPRTQSSLAVFGADAQSVVLINASPDIRQQLMACRDLQPARAARDTAIAAVLLMDAQIDHTIGLMMLRESTQPLRLWCTDRVYRDLTEANPLLSILGHYCGVERRRIALGEPFAIEPVSGVEFTALPLNSKPPPFSPNRTAPEPGDNIGLRICNTRTARTLFYTPGLGFMDELVWEQLYRADTVLIDGTFWSDDEMSTQGLHGKSARSMGHMPLAGVNGMLEWLTRLPGSTRKVLVHINNTNPILDDDSAERAKLTRCGVEVAYDGMELDP